jgi:uncharacterized protein (DUF433 family)
VTSDFDRISINPDICHGKPVISGTRVLVSQIQGAYKAGDTIDMLLEDYNITRDDIEAALKYEEK